VPATLALAVAPTAALRLAAGLRLAALPALRRKGGGPGPSSPLGRLRGPLAGRALDQQFYGSPLPIGHAY
jgi:hypothetical protein